ncbi:MAG: Deoxycytidine triphosphate deaminase (dUMP-forming), partial [uncultured Nocardioidaceae bacterium]
AALRPRHPGRAGGETGLPGALRRRHGAALERRRPARPVLPHLREPPLPAHRPRRGPAGADAGGRAGRRRALHPPPRRVRARVDVRDRLPSRRRRGAARGQVVAGSAGAADALDGGVHRPWLLRSRDPGAGERREPSDQAVAGHEDRPALLLPAVLTCRASLRLGEVRLPLPGAARAHTLPLVTELPPHPDQL